MSPPIEEFKNGGFGLSTLDEEEQNKTTLPDIRESKASYHPLNRNEKKSIHDYDDPMRSSEPSTTSVPGSSSHKRSVKENGAPVLLTGVSTDLAVSMEGRRDSAMRSSISKASVHSKRDSVFGKKPKG